MKVNEQFKDLINSNNSLLVGTRQIVFYALAKITVYSKVELY